MPKALFFAVPGHGHVNPSLPLVAELVKRGHHITYFITENFRAKVEATGAVFQPYTGMPNDYFDGRGLHGGVPQTVAYELINTTETLLPELLEIAHTLKPDYIIFDGMCPWGYMVARIMKLPAVSSLALLPLSQPPSNVLLNWKVLQLLFSALSHDFSKGMNANRRAQKLANQYHIQPLGLMRILNVPADLEISYTSAYFQPYVETVSKNVLFIGRTIDESATNMPFSFDQVKGRPLIYISMGTLNNDDVTFFKNCIQTFTNTGNYVIISTGNRIKPDSFGALPENIAIYGWVPQVEVIKRAALFITHAGLNSVHDGLYFGVPLLLVPQQFEQYMTAMRVMELGAGLMLQPKEASTESIRANAIRLLTDSQFKEKADRVGETFRNAGGVSRAVDEIEALLENQVT